MYENCSTWNTSDARSTPYNGWLQTESLFHIVWIIRVTIFYMLYSAVHSVGMPRLFDLRWPFWTVICWWVMEGKTILRLLQFIRSFSLGSVCHCVKNSLIIVRSIGFGPCVHGRILVLRRAPTMSVAVVFSQWHQDYERWAAEKIDRKHTFHLVKCMKDATTNDGVSIIPINPV